MSTNGRQKWSKDIYFIFFPILPFPGNEEQRGFTSVDPILPDCLLILATLPWLVQPLRYPPMCHPSGAWCQYCHISCVLGMETIWFCRKSSVFICIGNCKNHDALKSMSFLYLCRKYLSVHTGDELDQVYYGKLGWGSPSQSPPTIIFFTFS